MKSDSQDVIIPCFGQIRGCLVEMCTVRVACYKQTVRNECKMKKEKKEG